MLYQLTPLQLTLISLHYLLIELSYQLIHFIECINCYRYFPDHPQSVC